MRAANQQLEKEAEALNNIAQQEDLIAQVAARDASYEEEIAALHRRAELLQVTCSPDDGV